MRRRLRLAPVLIAVLVAASAGSAPVATGSEPVRRGATLDPAVEPIAASRRGSVDLRSAARDTDPNLAPARTTPATLDQPTVRAVTAGPAPDDATWTDAASAIQPGWAGIAKGDVGSRVAVGPEHVAQVLGDTLVIFDRAGGTDLPETAIGSPRFFDLPFGFGQSDATMTYDSLHGRWILAASSYTCDGDGDGIANDPFGFVDFGISRTADPTGSWDLYYITYEGYVPFDVGIGTSSDKFALSALLHEMDSTPTCASFATPDSPVVIVMDWATFATASPTSIPFVDFGFTDGGADGAYGAPHVAIQTPATSPTLYTLIRYRDGDVSSVEYTAVTGTATDDSIAFPANADLSGAGLVGSWEDPPTPEQPGAEIFGDFEPGPSSVTWRSGRLTWVSNHGCQPTGDTEMRTCVRVTQLTTTGASAMPSVRQDFVIGEAGAHHFSAAAGSALDGTLHVVWNRSADAPGGEISSVTGYQQPGDPVDHLSGPAVIQQGSGGPYGWNWYQDVAVAQDPQVPNAIWQAHPYAVGIDDWGAHVAQLQTGGATYVPITPVRVMDSRTATGVAGIYSSSTPRTFDVAGVGAIPDDAIAVTGNLTVTGQTSAGYAALTSVATSTPRSSTLNVPRGDTRANNVTATLASNGRLSAVWKGTSGSKAHLLLDVTGYFVAGDDDAAYTPLAPVRVLDSRAGTGTGLTGRFSSSVPRKLTVAGKNGIPADALAITANLTVVGQTSGGYVSVTTTSTPSPTTSNLNFPVGDVRANGLTAKLQGGAIWLVFKGTSSSARTDLLLDITGYYLADGDGLTFYPLEAGRIMDTRTSLLSGLTGTFKSSTPRRLDVDGHWGVPAGADAITGNLTVVGQTGAGYVSMTTVSTSTPTTSTINVPLGDTRANGITAPLSNTGNAFLVFKSSSGKATHLILDVTGYFR